MAWWDPRPGQPAGLSQSPEGQLMSREAALVLVLLVAPWALVLVVALLRGYSITLVMRRDRER